MGANYRYPGSRPFTGEYRDVFFGRDDDIRQLSTLVNVETTTVLYGKSGLGKSSLLNAGLLPHIQAERTHLVVPIRLGAASEHTTVHPLDILEEVLQQHAPAESFLSVVEHGGVTTWELLKNIAVADPERRSILLVFDQFEELFTYAEGVEEFAEALGSVLYNRMPKALDRALRLASARNPEVLTEELWEVLKRPMDVDVLMSIRSDRMSLLERLSSEIPTILHNCYELKPLSREQATTAIEKPAALEGDFISPPFTYQPATIEKILDFLTQQGRKPIETFQLQIFCEYAEQNVVVARNDDFVEPEDLGDLEEIYQNYYDTCIRKVANDGDERSLREFVEEGLIFADEERRVSLFEGQIQARFGISDAQIQKLVDSHLIRAEPHASGGFLYELCHDTLVGPILKAKERRKAAEAEEARIQADLLNRRRRKKKMVRAAWFGGVPFAFAVVSMAAYLFAHRNDLDIARLRGARLATTYEVEAKGPVVADTLSQGVGETRLVATGLARGSGRLTVTGSDGSVDSIDVEVTVPRVGVADSVDGNGPSSSNCYYPRCSIQAPAIAARALERALMGAEGPVPDSAQLMVPVSRLIDEPIRWRSGTIELRDVFGPASAAVSDSLVAVVKRLEFTVRPSDLWTSWQMPVVLRLGRQEGQDRITVGEGEEVTRNLNLRTLEADDVDPAVVSGFMGAGVWDTDALQAAADSGYGSDGEGVSLASLLAGSLAASALPPRGMSDLMEQAAVSPDGSLRWVDQPGAPWRLVGGTGDTLAVGSDASSVSTARFSADGRHVLVASNGVRQIRGVPYTITSYADANRVTVDVGLDGTPDSVFVLNAGEHALLQDPGWAGRVLGIEATAGVTVVETTRYWWEEITEATRARAVRPMPEGDPAGPWEYWVPYVDTVVGPNGGSSTVLLTAGFDNATVTIDLDHDGSPDSVVTLGRGVSTSVAVAAAGAVFVSDRPLSAAYQYQLTDWQTYEDGWLQYEIPPSNALGLEYFVQDAGGGTVVLATEDGTRLALVGEGLETTLARGEQYVLPPGGGKTRHISSDRPVMVAVAAFTEDRHGATYAYVVPPTRDTLFYVPPVSPHHYLSPDDLSRTVVAADGDSVQVSCSGGMLEISELHSCRGWAGGVVHTSRPVSAVFISEVEATDPYTGERRLYSYAHPLVGASGASTRYVLRPFENSALEGYQGGTAVLQVLDDRGRTTDSLVVDGRVVGTASRGRGAFRVAVEGDDVHVYTVGDDAGHEEIDLGLQRWVALADDGRHALAQGEDENLTWRDLKAGKVDTIPCSTKAAGPGCGSWTSVDVGGDGRLLVALRADGSAELWAMACLRHTACRASPGPILRHDSLVDRTDAPGATVSLSADGRYVLARSPLGGERLWDLNLTLPGRWSFDRVLFWVDMPILVIFGLLLVLAWPVFFLELIWGVSVLGNLRRRAEQGERGWLARVGRWLS